MMDTKQASSRNETLALRAAAAALVVGWIGSLLFYDWLMAGSISIGLGFPLLVLIFIIAALIVVRTMGIKLRLRVLWLILPIAFFGGMVAVRDETLITALNMGMTVALGGLALHYLPLKKAPDQDSTLRHIFAVTFATMMGGVGALLELPRISSALKKIRFAGGSTTQAVLRGVVIAVPIVLVFGVLLASADTVFSAALGGIFSDFTNLGDFFGHIVVTITLAWGVLGLITYGAREPYDFDEEATPAKSSDPEQSAAEAIVRKAEQDEKNKRLAGLGMIETSIVLGSVIALFAFFVMIQFKYLFGGQANISEGATYAEYARRGFFELVAVAVMVIGVGRYLHWQTRRQTTTETTLFRVECVALVGLTLVLLASAWQRMYLYELAYGFTHLRLYIYVFMLTLVGLFVAFLLEVFTRRKTIFAFGVLLAAIGFLGALNAINTEQFIAARNIDRYIAGEDLDMCYLQTFGVDALPEMLRLQLAARSREDDALEQQVDLWLGKWHEEISKQQNSPYAFTNLNVARVLAYAEFMSTPRDVRGRWDETQYISCYRDYSGNMNSGD